MHGAHGTSACPLLFLSCYLELSMLISPLDCSSYRVITKCYGGPARGPMGSQINTSPSGSSQPSMGIAGKTVTVSASLGKIKIARYLKTRFSLPGTFFPSSTQTKLHSSINPLLLAQFYLWAASTLLPQPTPHLIISLLFTCLAPWLGCEQLSTRTGVVLHLVHGKCFCL
jgi:hypothetical protein